MKGNPNTVESGVYSVSDLIHRHEELEKEILSSVVGSKLLQRLNFSQIIPNIKEMTELRSRILKHHYVGGGKTLRAKYAVLLDDSTLVLLFNALISRQKDFAPKDTIEVLACLSRLAKLGCLGSDSEAVKNIIIELFNICLEKVGFDKNGKIKNDGYLTILDVGDRVSLLNYIAVISPELITLENFKKILGPNFIAEFDKVPKVTDTSKSNLIEKYCLLFEALARIKFSKHDLWQDDECKKLNISDYREWFVGKLMSKYQKDIISTLEYVSTTTNEFGEEAPFKFYKLHHNVNLLIGAYCNKTQGLASHVTMPQITKEFGMQNKFAEILAAGLGEEYLVEQEKSVAGASQLDIAILDKDGNLIAGGEINGLWNHNESIIENGKIKKVPKLSDIIKEHFLREKHLVPIWSISTSQLADLDKSNVSLNEVGRKKMEIKTRLAMMVL